MSNKEFALTKIDSDLLIPVKIEAAKDSKTVKKWVSDVLRAELNKRYEHIFDIKSIKDSH